MYLRAISQNRLGGIIIPFNKVDKYDNWWDQNTELALDVFRSRPLLWWHNTSAEYVRCGTVDDSSLRVTPDGLYAEADIEENDKNRHVIAEMRSYLDQDNAGYSTGSARNWAQFRSDGYVEKWGFFELSVAPADRVISQLGTTTARYVRAVVDGSDIEVIRSGFMLNNVQEEKKDFIDQSTLVTKDDLKALLDSVNQINDDVKELRAQPKKQLPKTQQPTPQISVSSEWDKYNSFEMVVLHQLKKQTGRSIRDEAFVRALVDKVGKAHELDKKDREDAGYLRAMPRVDDVALDAWSKKFPYLRADEAMKTDTSGFGDDLVQNLFSAQVWRNFHQATLVMQQFPIVEMPSDNWVYPIIGSGPTVRHVTEISDQSNFNLANALTPTSQIASDNITFNAGKVSALTIFSEELVEDSNYDVLREFVESFRISMAEAGDEMTISGDETASTSNISHIGTDPTGTLYDKILALDGLRHMAVADSTSTAHTTISKNSFLTIQKTMGARGILGMNPKNLVAIVDPGVYYKIAELDAYESLNDVGPQATLLTGMIGGLKGVSIIVSDQLENTNASGQIEDSHDGTKGSFLIVNRRRVMIGRRRNITIKTHDNIPGVDGRAIEAFLRFDVQRMESGAVAYGYNTTV